MGCRLLRKFYYWRRCERNEAIRFFEYSEARLHQSPVPSQRQKAGIRVNLFRQQGATLITCMILITACILFTRILIENTLLEFRGKTNYFQKTESLNAAENTGAEIKNWLHSLKEILPENPSCAILFCTTIFRIMSEEELSSLEWWKKNGIKVSPLDSNEEAYVFIQLLSKKYFPPQKTKVYYEIFIFNHNINNQSNTLLKNVFLKTFDSKNQIAYPAIRIAWQQLQ